MDEILTLKSNEMDEILTPKSELRWTCWRTTRICEPESSPLGPVII